MNDTIKVFVSYAREDRPFVDRLAQALKTRSKGGVELVLDEQVIEPGEAILSQVSEAILSSNGIIVVIPSDSENPWTRTELALALAKEHRDPNFRIIPVVIGETSLPHLLRGRAYLDFSDEKLFYENIDRIVSSLQANKIVSRIERQVDLIEEAIAAQRRALNTVDYSLPSDRRYLQSAFWSASAVSITAILVLFYPMVVKANVSASDILHVVVPALTASAGFFLGRGFRGRGQGDKGTENAKELGQ